MKQFFADIYLILTLDCEGSAKLTSDSMDRELRWAEHVAATMHRMICAKSRKLDRQLVQLNSTIENGLEAELLPGAQERIRRAISDQH
jgi:hypothetical protein